jgi:hypothetical protein
VRKAPWARDKATRQHEPQAPLQGLLHLPKARRAPAVAGVVQSQRHRLGIFVSYGFFLRVTVPLQEPGFHRQEGVDLVPRIMEALAAAGLDAAAFPTRVILQSFQLSVRRQPDWSPTAASQRCSRTEPWVSGSLGISYQKERCRTRLPVASKPKPNP